MSALFEGKDEEERLNFAFNVLAGYKEQNKLEHYDSIIQTCLDNPEKCQENPSVALCVLVFTTEYRKRLPIEVSSIHYWNQSILRN